MTFLIDWAKNIVYYILFVKVLVSLMPSGKMSKYFKLFSGVLLIMILIQPLLQLKSFDEKMFTSILKTEMNVDAYNLKKQATTYEQLNNELALKLYIKNTKERIRSIVEESGVDLTAVSLKVNEDASSDRFGEIIEMHLILRKKSSGTKSMPLVLPIEVNLQEDAQLPKSSEDILIEKKLKSDLLDFYNVSYDNIHISIEKK